MSLQPLPKAPLSFPYRPVAALMGSLVSLCVGTSFAKTLFPAMGATGISAYRIGLAALLLVLVLRPWRRRWQRADLRPLALYGVTLGTMNLLFYLSIARIPLGLAIAINSPGRWRWRCGTHTADAICCGWPWPPRAWP